MGSGRNWFFLLVGFFISSFLGGAINVQVSPARIRALVESVLEKRDPKFALEFQEARLSLADGWMPQFAIEIRGLALRAKDPCMTASWLTADRFIIPVEIRSFFSQKFRLGHVRAGKVRFHYEQATCSQTLKSTETEEDGIAPLERFFQKRWSKEVVNTTKYLKDFAVDRFEFFRGTNGPYFHFLDTHLEFLRDEGESRIDLVFVPDEKWSGNQPFGPTQVEARIGSDVILAVGKGNLKEGQFEFDAHWSVPDSEFKFSVKGQDFPLQNFLGFARHWGVFPSLSAQFRNQWLSCVWRGHGRLRELNQYQIQVNQCRSYGDLGEFTIQDTELKPGQPSGPFPVVIQLDKIKVKEALESFGFGHSWGYLSQFGQFDGRLEILSSHELSLSGSIENLEIYLSSLASRVRQKIKKLNLKMSYDEKEFSGQIDSIDLVNGKIEGVLSYRISNVGDGVFQLALNQIRLPVEAQEILFGGRVPFFEIFGIGDIARSSFVHFQGQGGMLGLETKQWTIDRVKSKIDFNEGMWNLSLNADEFSVKPEGHWPVLVDRLFTTITKKAKDSKLYKISADISVKNGQGIWKNLSASHPDIQLNVFSEGSWTNKNILQGVIHTFERNKKMNQFSLKGNWIDPVVTLIETSPAKSE